MCVQCLGVLPSWRVPLDASALDASALDASALDAAVSFPRAVPGLGLIV